MKLTAVQLAAIILNSFILIYYIYYIYYIYLNLLIWIQCSYVK